MHLVTAPVRQLGIEFIYVNLAEALSAQLKVAFLAAILLTSPLLLWQAWKFVQPALYRKEKSTARELLLVVLALFFLGLTFGYLIVFVTAVSFFVYSGQGFARRIVAGNDGFTVVGSLRSKYFGIKMERYVMHKILIVCLLGILLPVYGQAVAAMASNISGQRMDNMVTQKNDRVKLTNNRAQKIYPGIKSPLVKTDPDFDNTFHRFMLGEVQQHGKLLTDQQKAMIALVTLTAAQKYNFLPVQIEGALNAGTTPVQIKEALYQIAPYVGFPNVVEALGIINKIFRQKGIKLPLENQSTVNEETRLEKGVVVQTEIFGDQIPKMRAAAPENLKHIQDYLSAFCFGDTYTRKILNLQDREILTMCAIASLGGCEPQLKAHIQGNINVGNNKDKLLEAMTQCLPYIGFPRTLNAINCINQVLFDKK